MSGIQLPVVAVGVDGSAESMVAAQWAAQEASRRHLSLTLVNGFTEPTTGFRPGYPPAPGLTHAMRKLSHDVLETAARQLLARFRARDAHRVSARRPTQGYGRRGGARGSDGRREPWAGAHPRSDPRLGCPLRCLARALPVCGDTADHRHQ